MEHWQFTLLMERYLDTLEQHYFGSVGNAIVDAYFRDRLHLDNEREYVIFHQKKDSIK